MVVETAVGDAGVEAGVPPFDMLLKYELPAVPTFPVLEPGLHFDME